MPLLGWALLGSASLDAQHTTVRPVMSERPERPLIRSVPNDIAWKVERRNIGDIYRERRFREALERQPERDPEELRDEIEERSPDPPITAYDIRTIYNGYSDGVRREVLEHRNGNVFIIYITGGLYLYEDPRRDRVVVGSAADLEEMGRSAHADRFGEFGWIRQANYVGIANYNGRECYVYQQTLYDVVHGRDAEVIDEEYDDEFEEERRPLTRAERERAERAKERMRERVHATAFIDRETKLPVGLEDRFSIQTYEFAELSEPVVLPPHYEEALEKQRHDAQRLLRRYNIPQ